MADDLDPPNAEDAHRQLTDQVAALQQELRAARAAGDVSVAELDALRGQLAEAQRELEWLRAIPPVPPTPESEIDFLDDVFSEEE